MEPLKENLWYQKVLSDIKKTDETKREMEHNFNPDMRDEYDDIIKEEAKQAADLLKLGADYEVTDASVTITVDEDEFTVSKDLLHDELGTDQYNLLINHGEEAKEEPAEVEDDIPLQNDQNALTMPDGTKIPSNMAPIYVMQQAMNQAMAAYTGKPVNQMYPAQQKVQSKSLADILRSISELQAQVISIDEERNKAISASSLGNKETKEKLLALSRELEDKKAELRDANIQVTNLTEALKNRDEKIKDLTKTLNGHRDDLNKAYDEVKEKDAKIAEIDKVLSSTRTDLSKALSDVREKDAKIAEINSSRSVDKDTINDLKHKLDKAQSELESRTSALDKKDRELESRENELKSKESEIEGKDKKIESLSNEKDRAVADKESAISEKDRLISKKDNEITGLKGRISSLEQKVSKLYSVDEYNKLSGKITQLQKKLNTKEDERQQLINEKQELVSKIYEDGLTGLPNDKALNKDLENLDINDPVIARINICGMEEINDANGYRSGDRVITYISEKLKNAFGNDAKVYRPMGAQFVVVGNKDADIRSRLETVKEQAANENVFIAYGTAEMDQENTHDIYSLNDIASVRMNDMRDAIYDEMDEEEPEEAPEHAEEQSSTYEAPQPQPVPDDKPSQDKEDHRGENDIEEDEAFASNIMASLKRNDGAR